MGLLHDLALMTEGEAPKGADGSVRTWVTLANLAASGGDTVDGHAANKLTSTTIIGGKPTADLALWLDSSTGLPMRRVMTVHFAEGDMHVTEIYDVVTLDDERAEP
jgi:hypothetical protein